MPRTPELEELEDYEHAMILKAIRGLLTDDDYEHHQTLWAAEEATRK